jgi:hypothetical protein
MKWKVIRLELGSSKEFPNGSAGRIYLVRLPLTEDGAICAELIETQPARATVRRYWPNQPDLVGTIIRTSLGYAIRYERNGALEKGVETPAEDRLFQFGANAIKVGEEFYLAEPDGRKLRFRVADLH